MNIIQRARGTEIPHRAQKVFFCCDPRSAGGKDKLIDDLLSHDAGMDCVVSYLEAPDADTEALRNELRENQALVLWVTVELLQSMATGNAPVEYGIAKELDIPILPIVEDGGLFPRFTELAGAIHGITRMDAEYRAKLKAQMETFLASEEIIKEIQEKAFTAELFLSYRKMDIHAARNFMKEFHNLEGFESVSIWYDNFLNAGRNFNYEIEESITKSDAFVLLVTPNLATKGNYVQTTEYPFARQQNKPVLPVEAVPTDAARFTVLFPGVDRPISLDDPAALRAAFSKKLGESACSAHMDSKRLYLLGMAYMKGYGVERDIDRAVRLLERAAESEDLSALDATKQLADVYEHGNAIGINYDEALRWRKLAVVYSEQLLGSQDQGAVDAYSDLASLCYTQGDYTKALELFYKALSVCEKVLGKEHSDTAISYNNIAYVYNIQGNYPKALELYHKAVAIYEKALGKGHPHTAISYNNIAHVYSTQGDYSKALELFHEASAIHEKVLGKEHPNTALSYNNIAYVYSNQGDYTKALELYHKALAVYEKLFGTEHPHTAMSYNNVASLHSNQGNYPKALELYHKALAVYEKLFGKEHPHTAMSYNNIAYVHSNQGDYTQALEWNHKALAIYDKVLGKEHPHTAISYDNIAYVYERQGDYPKALELYRKALSIRDKVFGKEHPLTARTHNDIVRVTKALEAKK